MKSHENMLKCTNSGHPGRLAARNTGARARPGLGLSKSIVIPKDLLRNPVGRRLSLRLAQPLGAQGTGAGVARAWRGRGAGVARAHLTVSVYVHFSFGMGK